MIAIVWRLAIVVVAVVGLMLGDAGLVYFTVQANAVVAVYFGTLVVAQLRGRRLAPRLRGGVTTWILATGIVYHVVIQAGANPIPGLFTGGPPELLSNWSPFLLHYVTPAMVLLDWIAFGPRRATRWSDSLLWAIYPLAYGAFMIVRGIALPSVDVRYPYPFLDPSGQGWSGVVSTVAWIVVAVVALGLVVVALDRLPEPRGRAGGR